MLQVSKELLGEEGKLPWSPAASPQTRALFCNLSYHSYVHGSDHHGSYGTFYTSSCMLEIARMSPPNDNRHLPGL